MSLKAICLKEIELRQVSSIYRNQDPGCPVVANAISCQNAAGGEPAAAVSLLTCGGTIPAVRFIQAIHTALQGVTFEKKKKKGRWKWQVACGKWGHFREVDVAAYQSLNLNMLLCRASML